MVVDTGANVSIIRKDLAQNSQVSIIWTPPCVSLQTVTDDKIHVHGKANITLRTECIIPGLVAENRKFRFGLIDYPDPDSLKAGILIASSVVDLSNSVILGRIANISDRTRTIQEVEVIAACAPVTFVDRKCNIQDLSSEDLVKDLLQNTDLDEKQRCAAGGVIKEFQSLFSRTSEGFGRTTKHRIDTGEHPLIKQDPRRLPFAKQEEVQKLIKDMKNNDVIEPSSSPWASSVVLVREKDGSTRFCVDYRRLNDVTKMESYPLPRIDDTLDTLDGNTWFSTLELKSGYWQLELHPDDKDKTAFTTGQGLWQFKVMPFGLCNGPATFESLMETVLGGLSYEACLVYLDDIIIVGRSFEEHPKNIRRVLQKVKKANLKLSPSKYHLFRREVTYLGHIISAGVRTDPDKISDVKDWNCPSDVHTSSGFSWAYARVTVNSLKDALTSAPILAYPEIGKQFILDTDASHESIGTVLSQEIEGQERIIAYFSKCLSKPERNYCVTRKELLAIVKAVEHFHPYLYGRRFLQRTDHASLTWVLNFKNSEGQIARLILRLQEYDVEIRHRKGSAYGNADALSKRPCPERSKYCSRIEKKFGVIAPIVRQVTTPSTSALYPWNDESVRKDQLADPEIKPIMEFKESSDEKPSWQDIAPFHRTTKRYWALWDSLHVKNGVLYRTCESDDGKTFRWQLILPKTRVSTVLKELHGSSTGGHFGVMKTLQKVRERFYWNNVWSDVEKCCRICDPCDARKGPRKRTRGRLQLYNVGAPFERIAFDILGPLSRSSNGNINILVAMDYFTKWPEAYRIPDQEASTVAEVLVQHWISRFGVPLQLHSDQGKTSILQFARDCLKYSPQTTALHPQSDGMVERFNRTILNSLSLLVSSNQQDWDKKLPFFLLAYRSAVHETTSYSPSHMIFGRDLRLPRRKCIIWLGKESAWLPKR
ncbi:retrovirus-related Pol polyprotein from transposon 412 [Trichonephila clavipes]|nr:retrovirus-related Pol polyprotein from transposon 412 [Trichonephila clavipes]